MKQITLFNVFNIASLGMLLILDEVLCRFHFHPVFHNLRNYLKGIDCSLFYFTFRSRWFLSDVYIIFFCCKSKKMFFFTIYMSIKSSSYSFNALSTLKCIVSAVCTCDCLPAVELSPLWTILTTPRVTPGLQRFSLN